MLLCHKGAKQNTIGVTRKTNAKRLHHRGLVLAYLMENKTIFVHHTIEWHGCNCIIEGNESLNERTQRHPMMKPRFKLMQTRWEQGRVLN